MLKNRKPGDFAALTIDAVAKRVVCRGLWVVTRIGGVEHQLNLWQCSFPGAEVEIDCTDIVRLDTSGALLLRRLQQYLEKTGCRVQLFGLGIDNRQLLEFVKEQGDLSLPAAVGVAKGFDRLGQKALSALSETAAMLSFFGRLIFALGRLLQVPQSLRFSDLIHSVKVSGYDALPIIGLLSFLIGLVIAYQGGLQLAQYGANIFIVDLVGLSLVRELAPLMTAIMVAGRTGSAYTAEIGSMKLNEEVDALMVIGIEPLERLVLPKLIGLLIVLPLLTVFADILGIFGGMAMANAILNVGPAVFWERLPGAISLTSYLIGIGKAPVFAAIIAVVGCYQGFTTAGSAEVLGRKTTTSVVQSIFLIIISDAAFSILFSWLGI